MRSVGIVIEREREREREREKGKRDKLIVILLLFPTGSCEEDLPKSRALLFARRFQKTVSDASIAVTCLV